MAFIHTADEAERPGVDAADGAEDPNPHDQGERST